MSSRLKILLVPTFCLFFSIWWWFGAGSQSVEEQFYPKAEYAEDISKIFFDLGKSAEGRGDWATAIRSFMTALENKPDIVELYHHLGRCYERQGDTSAAHKMYLAASRLINNTKEQPVIA